MKKIDFNNLLLFTVILSGVLINFISHKNNYSINSDVVALSSFLCFEVVIILFIGKKTKNYLLTYLGFFLIFFYVFRVITLLLFDANPYLSEFDLNANDYKKTLEAILIFVPIIVFASIFGKKYCLSQTLIFPKTRIKKNFKYVMIIAFTGLLPNILTKFELGFVSYIGAALRTYYPQGTIVLFTIVYYLTNISLLGKKQKLVMHLFFCTYILISLLSGNKSSAYNFGMMFMVAFLAINDTILLRIKHVLYSFLFLNVSIYLYFLGNIIRDVVWRGQQGLGSLRPIISSLNVEYLTNSWKFLASHIFGRIGFLDYTARIIKNSIIYKPLFTLSHYFQSFFDNLLPGTFFDAVRASTGIGYIDAYSIMPTQSEYMTMDYNSNAITGFGEFYVLGSGLFIGSLYMITFLFLFLFLFSRFVVKSKSETQYNILKSLALGFFSLFLNSFGLDWGLITLFMNLFFYEIFKKYYA